MTYYPTVSNYARAYVRARAEAHMNSSVRINRGGRGVSLDRTTGLATTNTGSLIYTGKARIWSLDKNGPVSIGDSDLVLQTTQISIPWQTSTIPDNDDVVTVTACPGDPDVVGRSFRIIGTDGAALSRATRRLTCVTLAENRSWNP